MTRAFETLHNERLAADQLQIRFEIQEGGLLSSWQEIDLKAPEQQAASEQGSTVLLAQLRLKGYDHIEHLSGPLKPFVCQSLIVKHIS